MNDGAVLHSMPSPQTLKAAWELYRQVHPRAGAWDAAAALGVSELELLATDCGENVIRLAANWAELVYDLAALGPVRAYTRNAHAVHEKDVEYRSVRVLGANGLIFDDTFSLRLFMGRLQHGFACSEPGPHGTRRSLQFFDAFGDSVHKLFLTEHSDHFAYESFVAAYHSTDQDAEQAVRLPVQPRGRAAANKVHLGHLCANWQALGAAYDFGPMLACHGFSTRRALRLGGRHLARPVDPSLFGELIQAVVDAGLEVELCVGNTGACQSHSGPLHNLHVAGSTIGVLDDGFRLQVRTDHIADAWVIRTAGPRGEVQSLALYDAHGERLALLRAAPERRSHRHAWHRLLAAVPSAHPHLGPMEPH